MNLFTSPDRLGKINLAALEAKDTKWSFAKQKPTQFADAKHEPGVTCAPEELLTAEGIQAFIDKHAMQVLGKTEEGQEFLKQLKENPPESVEGWDG